MPTIKNGETLDIKGVLNVQSGTVNFTDGQISRSKSAIQTDSEFVLTPDQFRVWDDLASLLPGTAAADDLAVIEGTFGTDAPTIQTADAKATSVTQRARVQFSLPENYVDGETIVVRMRSGMVTTISDGTATIDVEAYAYDDDGSVGSDLCATAAQSINSLTKANTDFTITPTGLTSGDVLDIRVTISITDTATGTAVIGEISKPSILMSVR